MQEEAPVRAPPTVILHRGGEFNVASQIPQVSPSWRMLARRMTWSRAGRFYRHGAAYKRDAHE